MCSSSTRPCGVRASPAFTSSGALHGDVYNALRGLRDFWGPCRAQRPGGEGQPPYQHPGISHGAASNYRLDARQRDAAIKRARPRKARNACRAPAAGAACERARSACDERSHCGQGSKEHVFVLRARAGTGAALSNKILTGAVGASWRVFVKERASADRRPQVRICALQSVTWRGQTWVKPCFGVPRRATRLRQNIFSEEERGKSSCHPWCPEACFCGQHGRRRVCRFGDQAGHNTQPGQHFSVPDESLGASVRVRTRTVAAVRRVCWFGSAHPPPAHER